MPAIPPPVPFHQIAQDFANLIKGQDVRDLQAQISTQLSQLVGQGMLLAISYEELQSRGYTISADTRALIQVFNLLALGAGDKRLGLALPSGALDLKRLMGEVMPADTAKAIVDSLPDTPTPQHRLPDGIQKKPTINNPGGVVTVDFRNRQRLH